MSTRVNTDVRRTGRLPRKLAATAAALGLAGMLAGLGTWSAFSDTTANENNSFATGTVVLTDDQPAATPMYNLTALDPTDPVQSRCIVVSYSGTLPATVRLYGSTGGTGLADYLNLKVTRGVISPTTTPGDCTNFSPDATNYLSQGNGVIYNGTLAGYPDDESGAIVDPKAAAPESWTNPESHAYKFEISVADNNDAQGKTATQRFTWLARH